MLLTQLIVNIYILRISGKYVNDCIISLTAEDSIKKIIKKQKQNKKKQKKYPPTEWVTMYMCGWCINFVSLSISFRVDVQLFRRAIINQNNIHEECWYLFVWHNFVCIVSFTILLIDVQRSSISDKTQ